MWSPLAFWPALGLVRTPAVSMRIVWWRSAVEQAAPLCRCLHFHKRSGPSLVAGRNPDVFVRIRRAPISALVPVDLALALSICLVSQSICGSRDSPWAI